jgi:response regulator RpfG family c-di-GMP phosphodiesterase
MSDAANDKPLLFVVDDDLLVLTITKRVLARGAWEVRTFEDSRAALVAAMEEPPWAVVADLNMPELDGVALLALLAHVTPSIVRVLHTGQELEGALLQRAQRGAFHIVPKSGQQPALSSALAELRASGEQERPAQRLSGAALALALSDAIGPLVGKPVGSCLAHAQRAQGLGLRVGATLRECEALGIAAHLHDLAMATIPRTSLAVRGPLHADAQRALQLHPARAVRWFEAVDAFAPERLRDMALRFVAQHHERIDGGGYPLGLYGEAISLGARVLSVVDAYDAMQRVRPHAPAMCAEAARAELQRCAGTQFDARVVQALLDDASLH